MLRRILGALALVSASSAFALAHDPERGLAFAREHCAVCHAVGPTGASPRAAAPPFRVIARRYPPEHLQEALAEGIVVGHDSGMPEFRLAPRDIDDVIAHLRRLRATN